MSNNNSRALRRFHRARLIKKYMKYEMIQWRDDVDHRRMAAMMVNHITSCSCPMCCNPRHNRWLRRKELLSMQERKAEDAFEYELEELLN